MTDTRLPVRRALLSVSDKTGIVELARTLASLGVELLSTGGTAKALREAGVAVVEVGSVTGFPEIMGGRVKTLHPKIHGALLGRPGLDDEVMAEHGIESLDLLVLNLYPFERVTARPECSLNEAIENIDIGGPAMLRAAAKNHARVAVLSDAEQYPAVLAELIESEGRLAAATRFRLAVAAFGRVAAYDAAIAGYLSARLPVESGSPFPSVWSRCFEKVMDLRYGENPHQAAAFYRDPAAGSGLFSGLRVLQGKAVGYNNLADADAAWECVRQFERPACCIVKHANPCGVAEADDPGRAYALAYATDPTSAFGGIVAFNRPVDGETLALVLDRQFVEVLVAPAFTPEAVERAGRKPNVRLIEVPTGAAIDAFDCKRIGGGLLVQTTDNRRIGTEDLRQVSQRAPTADESADLIFAWRVAKFVKSNAIVYARDGRTIAIGAGQMSRVDSARIAALKAEAAGLPVAGAVMASDAFFPFRDGIDAAAAAGVCAVIQPGGSMRDAETIAAADQHGMAMVFTGVRHFRH